MKTSVALCTYNGERYLLEQLESIAGQSVPVDEIVICDDRSTDRTPDIIRSFAATSTVPVRAYFNEENLGSNKNFEKAIELCSGEIIFLSDQDDVWMPRKMERFLAIFDADPEVGLIFSDALLVNEELRPTRLRLWQLTFRRRDRKRFQAGDGLEVLLEKNVITGATMAFRSDLRRLSLPVPHGTDMIHDGWISLMAALYTKIAMISEPLVKYRQHQGQQLGVLLPKLSVPIRERHTEFIENRRRALVRLQMLREAFSADLEHQPRLPRTELLKKIDQAEREVRGSIEHFDRRAAMPASRLLRLPFVAAELFTGRYHRHTKGFVSAAMDIFSK